MLEQIEIIREQLKQARQSLMSQHERYSNLSRNVAATETLKLEAMAFQVLSKQSFIATNRANVGGIFVDLTINIYNAAFRYCLESYVLILSPLKSTDKKVQIKMYVTALLAGKTELAMQILSAENFKLTDLGPNDKLHANLLEITACLGTLEQMSRLLDLYASANEHFHVMKLLALDKAIKFARFDNAILLIQKGGSEITPHPAGTNIQPLQSLLTKVNTNNAVDASLTTFIKDIILPAIQNNEREEVVDAKIQLEQFIASSMKTPR